MGIEALLYEDELDYLLQLVWQQGLGQEAGMAGRVPSTRPMMMTTSWMATLLADWPPHAHGQA